MSIRGPVIGGFPPSTMIFYKWELLSCRLLSAGCSMLLAFWANADFPTLGQSMFTMSLKHFFCPYAVSMPVFHCPLGNCFDNPLSASLLTRPTHWNWITISMTFLPVYWQCSGPWLMQIILPFNFKYSIQGELPRNWAAYKWQASPQLRQVESPSVGHAVSSQLGFHVRNQNWPYHSQSLLFSPMMLFYIF